MTHIVNILMFYSCRRWHNYPSCASRKRYTDISRCLRTIFRLFVWLVPGYWCRLGEQVWDRVRMSRLFHRYYLEQNHASGLAKFHLHRWIWATVVPGLLAENESHNKFSCNTWTWNIAERITLRVRWLTPPQRLKLRWLMNESNPKYLSV